MYRTQATEVVWVTSWEYFSLGLVILSVCPLLHCVCVCVCVRVCECVCVCTLLCCVDSA